MALAAVLDIEREIEDGVPVVNIKCDGSATNETADHFNPPGEDSLPLPGDVAALTEGAGSGGAAVAGYLDPKNEGKAEPGEKRLYARDASGAVVCEIWLKGASSIRFERSAGGYIELKDDGKVEFNGVIVDLEGNVEAPLEITAMAASALVTLSKHTHPTAMGPSGPPVPGG